MSELVRRSLGPLRRNDSRAGAVGMITGGAVSGSSTTPSAVSATGAASSSSGGGGGLSDAGRQLYYGVSDEEEVTV